MRDFPASGRRRPARDPDPDLAVRAHDSGGRAVRSGAPDSRLRAVRSLGEAEYTHPLDAARASRRRAPPVPTRPAAAGSRSRSSARRQVAAAREAARAPSAAAVRPERRQLLATRDTGSARPARLRGGRRSGVHGHDGGDADVQSCSAVGQGENSRFTPMACSRRAVCDNVQSQRRGLERIGRCLAEGPHGCAVGARTMSDMERRDWCFASIACRRGSLTRGQANGPTWGAALRLAS